MITDPVSVVIEEIRKRRSAGRPSVTVSTRLARSLAGVCRNVTGGRVIGVVEPPPPVPDPVRVIESSHSVAEVPSPGSGIDWASAYESTVT